ncbi:tRNA preQ1(34) S-adenosylmethionine ribosyltransferase-isomerase QueA [Chitinispirillales bacterium ANBcel5]|uniref:tRNA preQ1(34) S-adenosylmethionine ribosyltransferase-isomerase QueA n=1 Tax=Cellulosispirillum alkaliphilum TaxID=3039283 RepID=UPI002A5881A7|nr:tRNA preQ1(34) S-adenosylmethionine ribosyltransferase-isomerase QueA [Chitinispirillales bacterium ANBcel5]
MLTDDFHYELPEHLIAQEPLKDRDSCKLLSLSRKSGQVEHLFFKDLHKLLKAGDRLVFNNTKVIPSRLFCRKPTGAALELFMTERINQQCWKAMIKPARKVPPGSVMILEYNEAIQFKVGEILDGGERKIQLIEGAQSVDEVLEKYGKMPLPHYIQREEKLEDRELYQTVYAKNSGAVAAPTAGLHFTPELINRLKAMGVETTFITLHVGIGTFRPVKVKDPRKHNIHEERYELSEDSANEINRTWLRGGRVIAVGTTVVRVLEHCATGYHNIEPSTGKTTLMILPPFEFKATDVLITNFHLPRSTLLMLVSSFASREKVLNAYNEAVGCQYRFFSYGDAMIIN